MRLLRHSIFLAAIALAAAPLYAQRGALTAPRDLDQLTAQAVTIVRGRVISAMVEPHPQLKGLSTIVVTVAVDKALKGDPGPTFTFRQFIWDVRDRADAAGYRRGQEVLLFMNAPSQYGLTSPVGMEQGRFRVLRDRAGNATAVNGRNNMGLFQNVTESAQQRGVTFAARGAKLMAAPPASGPVRLDALEEVVAGLVGAQ